MFLPLPAAELTWKPVMGVSAAYKADGLQDYLSSSFQAGAEISLLSFSVDGRHGISLPFSVSYSTIGNEVDYVRKQDEVIFTLEARYSYRFTELLSLAAGCGVKGMWHLGTEYLSASAGGTLIPSFDLEDNISITVPVSFYGSRNDWSFSAGIGCMISVEVPLW